MGAKEGPNKIKQAFAGLPDLNQCEELIDYGNVEHDHDSLIDTQQGMLSLQRNQFKIINKLSYLVVDMMCLCTIFSHA